MGKQAQASTHDALVAQVAELAQAVALLTQAGKRKSKAGKGKSKAQQARKALRERNVAAGRMATARYGCASAGCKFGSWNKEPAERHTLKAGHSAVELA